MKFIDIKGAEMRGVRVPALGFGTWQLRGETCVSSTVNALRLGYRHIDTAQIYENEAEVGAAIVQSGVAREKLFVTTKLWTTNFTADRVASSTRESLKKLGMDYVDLLLIHWPNPEVPLGETLDAMQKVLEAGHTRAIGVSNFPVALMREAVETHGAPVACNQVEYHALLSQAAVLDYARAHDILVTAYSPLARGKLIGHATLDRIGRKYGKSSSQVALRWVVQQPGVCAIPKAASESNARHNLDIFDFVLDAEDMADIFRIRETLGDQRLIHPEWSPVWDA